MTSQKPDDTPPSQTPPRRRTGLMSFGVDIRRLLSPILGKKGFIQADILARWEEILGPALANGVTPVSVSFSKTTDAQTVLHVNAISGAYAVEFSARKTQILERINTYFGYCAVSDIRLTQGGISKKPLKKTPRPLTVSSEKRTEIKQITSEIGDSTLRSAVEELGLLIEDPKNN